MIKARATQSVEVYLTNDQLANAITGSFTSLDRLYIKDGKVFNSDAYGPWDDSLVSEKEEDVILVRAADIIRKRGQKA